MIRTMDEVDPPKGCGRRLATIDPGNASIRQRKSHVIQHRQVTDQVEVLKDKSDQPIAQPSPLRERQPRNVLAIKMMGSAGDTAVNASGMLKSAPGTT